MQNIDLICVGKLNAKYFAEGVAEYQKRLAAFASFRIVELPEEKIEEKNASDAVVKKALDALRALTFDHAIRLMTDNGVPATAPREERDGYIEYTVRIPTAAAQR